MQGTAKPQAHLVYHAAEDIPEKAVCMDSHKHILFFIDIAHNEGEVSIAAQLILEGDSVELSVDSRYACLSRASHEYLILHSVSDQIGNRNYLHIMKAGKIFEFRETGHSAVVIHYFADHACWGE